jgi:hypothetical protein
MTNYFYNGKHVVLLSYTGTHDALVRVQADFNEGSEKFNPGADLYVKVAHLDAVCDTLFAIGDKVRTVIEAGTLTGVVTAFEYKTNRLVVTSDKICNYRNDRTRYAYKPSEIAKIIIEPVKRPTYKFEKGKFYKLNSKFTVHAIAQPDGEFIMLVDRLGNIILQDVPPIGDAIGFSMAHGINNVQEMKKF